MQGKEPERGVAALRRAESDAALREKTRRDDALMFGISMKKRGNYPAWVVPSFFGCSAGAGCPGGSVFRSLMTGGSPDM